MDGVMPSASGAWRVIRGGGCWGEARDARSACRLGLDPWARGVGRGFRVLLPAAPPAPVARTAAPPVC